jgi:hypothetical protein
MIRNLTFTIPYFKFQFTAGQKCNSFDFRKLIFIFSTLLPFILSAQDQNNLWSPVSEKDRKFSERSSLLTDVPDLKKGKVLRLQVESMMAMAKTAKNEIGNLRNETTIIELPLPDGTFQKFQIWESSLMEPELAAKYPEIQSYIIRALDNPFITGRMTVSPYGFGATFTDMVKSQEVVIRKILKEDPTIYLSFWRKDDPANDQPFKCDWQGDAEEHRHEADHNRMMLPNETGDVLRVFRLAMTVTGSLAQQQGWTSKPQALAAVVTFLGEINTIYERDLSVRFVLPVGEENLLFLDDATDPFTAYGGGESANENIIVTNALIGSENFDIGLVMVTNGCCAAGKPSICSSTKAWNFSRFNNLNTTSHEIGHQFNADHTWTSCGPSNNGQFGTNEYGSGTTIMSYKNNCGVDNIIPAGNLSYFGVYSQIQMTNQINAQSCYKSLNTGNNIPTSNVPASGFHIPISTPFELVGTGSDADGDSLTYSWEQVNIRNVDFTATTISIQTPPTPADGNVPIQRMFYPSPSPRRTIPQLSDLLSNTSTIYERLPTYTRNIKYRMYVRDNHPGCGGTTHQEVSFQVDGTAGPFLVTAPNTNVTWQQGSSQTVTWDVANTTNANVNCQNVKISLSLDGGYNYEYVLAVSTPNDGTQNITLPSGVCSNTCRIKVEAVGNIFFDISNTNFTIENSTAPVKAEMLTLDGTNDQIEIQSTTLGNFGTGNFTIEMWVKTTDQNSTLITKRPVCDCDNFWHFNIKTGKINVEFISNNLCNNQVEYIGTNTTVADGNWHHVAFVRSGTNILGYVDGVLDINIGNAHLFNFSNSAKIIIGNQACSIFNSNTYFTGNLDDVRIWNVARTVTEINNNMNCTLTGNESDLLAYYPIEGTSCNASSLTVTDKTSNTNHGIMQNGVIRSLSTKNIPTCPTCTNGNITINSHPTNQSGPRGTDVTYTISATGSNLSFQWYRSTNGGTSFDILVGETMASYTHTIALNQNNYQFRCLISNGCDVQQSNAATLTLTCTAQTLSIITGPASPCQDNYYTYYATPNVNIATWNWTSPSGWSITNFGNMIFVKPSATSGNISITGTDYCGNNTNTQSFAVTPVLVQITTQPVSQTVTEGTNVNFTTAVSGGGGTTNYVWQQSTDGGQTYSNISGASAATYSITSAGLSLDDRKFRCIVSNSCLTDTTNTVTLTVNCSTSAPATPGVIAGGNAICANAVLIYSIDEVPGASSYIWTLPAGWTGTSTTKQITVTANGSGGNLMVRSVNSCGSSANQSLPISINSGTCRRAVHFDGINDHLSVGQNGQALQGDMTLSFWVKPDILSGQQTLIFNGMEFIISLNGSQVRYKHSDDCCGYDNTVEKTFTGNLTLNTWQYVAVTRTTADRTLKFYLNGNLVNTQTYGASFAQPGNNLENMIFGAGNAGQWLNFKGSLDEIKIWSAARTASEIMEDMICYPVGNESNLKAYYGLENGQPYGNNPSVTNFINAASAYSVASVQNLTLSGPFSNVVSGDLPAFSYKDMDSDGYGGEPVTCGYSGTTASNGIDCNDNNAAIKPDATEICGNGVDENCNGVSDENTLSLGFDGVDDQVTAGNTIGNFGPGNFTIEMRVKTSATNRVLISKRPTCDANNNTWNIIVNGSGKLYVEMFQAGGGNGVTNTSTSTINDNVWHHVAIVRNGTNLKTYIDGVQDQSIGVPAVSYDNTAALLLGDNICSNVNFSGQLEEVRIWNIARSVYDINLLKNASLTGTESGLQTYYDFNNSPAIPGGNNTGLTNLDDRSPSNNDGSLVNFALSGSTSNWLGNPVNVNIPGNPSSTPTLCINTTLTNITHTTTGATGIGTPTGLPSGVMAAWAGNTITISGTPSTSGVFNYTIPLTGGCGTVNATGTITVNPLNTAGTPSANPTLCINSTLTNITRTTTGATGIGTPMGLPAGVNAAWASNTLTISGTPSVSGVFNYTIPLTGGCGTVNATGTITVNPLNTGSVPSSTPTTCINTSIPNITHNTTGATGIGSATGLPSGVSATWASNIITISGTPTVGGTFNYTIPLTGGCSTVNATGTITVNTFSGYHDNDNDGFGGAPLTTCPTGNWVTNNYDCNDNNATIKPDATETCGNSVDENCNGIVDENTLSLHFDGTNDQVNANNTFGNFGTGNFTIEFSIKSATPSLNKCIISKRDFCGCANFWNIIQRNDGKLMVEGSQNASCGNGTNVTSNNIISDNNWHHIAIVRSGTSLKIYIDGIEDINGFSSTDFNNSANIVLGNNTCSGVNFNGQLDEVRIWNVARSANDINLLKNASISGSESGLLTYYDFNNSPAIPGGNNAGLTVLDDRSSSNNDGTLVNFVLSGNTGNWLGNPTQPIQSVGLPSSNPTLCINTALTPITRTTTGATGIGTPTGLPPGVTAAWSSNTITISGTPTSSSTYNYSIPLTGGCGIVNATGTIIVTPNNIAATVSNTTLCIGTTITRSQGTTGATGIGTPTGLPAGVTVSWASNTITFAGSPSASGTFNYTIPLTGGCGTVNATGAIIVTPNNAAATVSNTTLCIGTTITRSQGTTGATGIGTPTGLPAGVTVSWASNTITFAGSPSASGTFNYTIPLTGGCGTVNATGAIIVTPNNTAATVSNTTLCIGTTITRSQGTTGATGIGTPTGLPAGVTVSWASNTITFAGSPSASGTFNYTIPLTGGCGTVNATGAIIVTPNNTAATISNTTLCIGTTITRSQGTTGATGIGTPAGLPAGVTVSWASNTITFAGSPSASGTFNYTIPLTGGCGTVNATGAIIVNAVNTVGAASSTPSYCINTAITNITHTTTGATGIGAPTGLPAGVTAAWASNTITISGTPVANGVFNYTIPLTGGCGNIIASGTISSETIAPTITCAANITINNTPNLCTGTTNLSPPTVTDNCNILLKNALNFDGINDIVSLGSTVGNFGTGNFTIEVWVKIPNVIGPREQIILSKRLGCGSTSFWNLQIDEMGRFIIEAIGDSNLGSINSATTQMNFDDDKWHHVAWARNGLTHSLYVDGILLLTANSGSLSSYTNTANLHLGKNDCSDVPPPADWAASYFKGTMDELRIWNVARTQTQIVNNRFNELNSQANLIVIHHFNHGNFNRNNTSIPGPIVNISNDDSGNNYHGNLNNFALNGITSNWAGGYWGSLFNNAPNVFGIGNTVVNWVATDQSGNTNSCNQTVTTIDNQNPVAICPNTAPTVTLDNAGNGTLNANALAGGNSTDNCSRIETSPLTNFTCVHIGVQTVVLTSTDGSGNAHTTPCSVNVVPPSCASEQTRTWMGSISTAWNNPCNWSPICVPQTLTPVIVSNAGLGIEIQTGQNITIKSIELQPGSSLIIQLNAILNVDE